MPFARCSTFALATYSTRDHAVPDRTTDISRVPPARITEEIVALEHEPPRLWGPLSPAGPPLQLPTTEPWMRTDLDAILTRDEVAAWLKVKPRQVERLGVPCLDLGRKTKRYVAKDVLAWLQMKRGEAGRPGPRR